MNMDECSPSLRLPGAISEVARDKTLIYIGQLWDGGTCRRRLEELCNLGIKCIPFDTTPFGAMGSRIERSILHRLHAGRGARALNAALLELANTASYDAVWVDKGVWIYPETLRALRDAAKTGFAVHYTPDPQILYNKSRHFLRSIALYDLIVTTKHFEVPLYQRLGARDVLVVLQGFGRIFAELSLGVPRPEIISDVSFVGRCEAHYARQLKIAARTGCNLNVWGPRWPRYAKFHRWARPHVRGNGIWGAAYPQALQASKIAIGLLSKLIPEQTTTRNFEIPASGTFMLAERTQELQALFTEGKEAEFFSSPHELQDKIQLYLKDHEARERIARAGRERCMRSGYGDANQIARILERVSELLAAR